MDTASLLKMYSLNHQVLRLNTEGLTHEDSLVQPARAGNCLNWVMGHVLVSRNGILRLANAEPIWSEAEESLYKRGSEPMTDGAAAMRFEKMIQDLETSQERLAAALPGVTAERLAQASLQGTVNDMLDLLQFHEAYHAGQIGLLRRLIGKEGQIR